MLGRLESVNAADGEQALDTRKDGIGIVALEQLNGHVEKLGPFCGEVVA